MAKSIQKTILDILRFLDARRPITSKEVHDILKDKELSEDFLKAISNIRNGDAEEADVSKGKHRYNIKLVKDLGAVAE